jgi:ketosteroid isomerase-like protein
MLLRFYTRVLRLTFLLAFAAPVMAEPVHYTPVMDISQQWAGYWNAKNIKALMTLYAPEPVFHSTVGATWDGAAQIRKGFAGILKNYDPDITLHSLRSQTSGTLAYDSGTYDETIARVKGGAPIKARGSYLFLFQKQKRGGWKILEQTWTEREPVKF